MVSFVDPSSENLPITFPSLDSVVNPLFHLEPYSSDLTTGALFYTPKCLLYLLIIYFFLSVSLPSILFSLALTRSHAYTLSRPPSLPSKSTLSAVQGLKPRLKPFQCCWLDPPCKAKTKMSFRKLDNRPHLHGFLSAIQIFKRHSLHHTVKLQAPPGRMFGETKNLKPIMSSNTQKQHSVQFAKNKKSYCCTVQQGR